MEGQYPEAICGYEKAVLQSNCDPALFLDFAVTLSRSADYPASVARLEQARNHVSPATPRKTVKNIYKSLTYSLLFLPDAHERVIQLTDEYGAMKDMPFSGGIAVNRICAFAHRFRALATRLGFIEADGKPMNTKSDSWPSEMIEAFDIALSEIRSLLEKEPSWRNRIEILMSKDFPAKDASDDDLEVFENFPEF
jgi:hypothetical protein